MKNTLAVFSFCFPLAACDVRTPPGNTGGVDLDDAGAGDCPRGLVVAGTDYQSTNVSLVGLDGAVLSSSFISSASESTGLSSPLSGDVVLPTERPSGDELVLIDRYPASVLTWVNLETAGVRAQLSVRSDTATNPHDYVELSAEKAYVTRFDHDDVLVIDPSVPELGSSIDLREALSSDERDLLARPDRALLAGNRLIVLLAVFSADFRTQSDSRLLAIDPESDQIIESFRLEGLRGCWGLTASPGGERVAVSCAGVWSGDLVPTSELGGIAIVSVAGGFSELARFGPSELGSDPVNASIAFAEPELLAFTTAGRFESDDEPGRDDAFKTLEIDGGNVETLLHSREEPFSLGGVRCTSSCGVCFVADAENGVVHRFEVSSGALRATGSITTDTEIGLMPRHLGFF